MQNARPRGFAPIRRPRSALRAHARGVAALLALHALTACGREAPPATRDDGDSAAAGANKAATTRPPAAPAARPASEEAETWNSAQIGWETYEAGLARAKLVNKPICLVLYTTWCPHCRTYSHVFDDPKVVERSHDFVMIRVNADEEPDLNQRFSIDGSYIPRTFFLAPDGTLAADIRAFRPQFVYFYDERSPAALLAGMDAAAARFIR